MKDFQGTPYASDNYRPDPNYKPRLPPGEIAAIVERQRYSWFFSCPKYFYVDENYTCVQCGKVFVFSAKEQKYWYETIQLCINAHPYRCPDCRIQKRNANLVIQEVGKAKKLVKENLDDPESSLQQAIAICTQFLQFGYGKLEHAIASARKCFKRDPEYIEALFYEALAEQLRKRPTIAVTLFVRFLQMAQSKPTYSDLFKKAHSQLKKLLVELKET